LELLFKTIDGKVYISYRHSRLYGEFGCKYIKGCIHNSIMSNAYVRAYNAFIDKLIRVYPLFDLGVIDDKELLSELQPEKSMLTERFNDMPAGQREIFWPGLEELLRDFKMYEMMVKLH
jgi:hypothetical protein